MRPTRSRSGISGAPPSSELLAEPVGSASTNLRWMRKASSEVESVRRHLLTPSPELWTVCIPQLENAIHCLESVEQELRSDRTVLDPARQQVASELRALQHSVRVVFRLIDNAAHFYRGWAELLAAAAGGYTREGRPADLKAPVQLSIRG